VDIHPDMRSRRARGVTILTLVGVVLVAASLAGAPAAASRDAPVSAAGAPAEVECRGSVALCRARVSLAGGARNRRVVVRLSGPDLALASARPNRRSLRGAYLLEKRHLSADGLRYVVRLTADQAIPRGSFVILTFRAPARPRLRWKACEDAPTVQCATLRVPLNWSRPQGPKVSLALTRRPAADRSRRVGSLLFNCGGPGCPGAQVVKALPDVFTQQLRDRFDIVGFDPRATGESTPIRCGLPSSDPTIPIYPATEADFNRLVTFNTALARSCRQMSGDYLMNVGSSQVIRDMEAIRASLRDGKLNWLGLSYGTMLGALYAERYPKRIRTMAIDGLLDRGLSEPGMLAAEARAAEDGFERWAAWCTTSTECPLQGQDVLKVWDDLIAAANRSPIPAANVNRGVTGEEIQNTTDGELLLFKRPTPFAPGVSWLSIGPAIVKALNGDASDFADQSGTPPTDPAYGERAISCLELPTQVRNFAEFVGRTTIARIIAPHLGGANQTGRVITQCIGWPRPRSNPRHFLNIKGAPPALIVNATHDPSTSYVWALSVQAQFPRSVLLTRDGDGHTSYLSSPCAQAAIDRYLIERAVPSPGTVCHD
jgi:pimeloyl-ACP methyl ester carboxylesterase